MSPFTAWMVEKLTPLAVVLLFEAIDIWEGGDDDYSLIDLFLGDD